MSKLKIAAILASVCLLLRLYDLAYELYLININNYKAKPILWLDVVIVLLGIAGFFQFIAKGLKYSKLLRVFLFIESFELLLALIGLVVTAWLMRIQVRVLNAEMIFQIIKEIVTAILAFTSLYILTKDRRPLFEIIKQNESDSLVSYGVKSGSRFFHFVIDTCFIIGFFTAVYYNIITKLEGNKNVALFAGVFWSYLNFLYYFILESFFGVTLGKILTNTVVVDSVGRAVGFWRGISRGLFRILLLPFDPFSFLFKDRGWHDVGSNTYVVNDQYAWENEEDTFDTYFTGEPETEPTTTLIP
jgi:uncharacterized RDD family membrane protein YckC